MNQTSIPYLRRNWYHTSLQFEGRVTQSRMLTFWPGHLLVGYTRTMLAALLWQPTPRRIGMIGLGGGSQVKFIHRTLPDTRLEVVENNAAVIALRRQFHIPEDGPRLQVIHSDGAQFVREHPGHYNILLVDAYDVGGIPAALSTRQYYDDCRMALIDGGVMASNLFCEDMQSHIEHIEHSFGKQRVLRIAEPGMHNQVIFAWTGDLCSSGQWTLPMLTRQIAPRARRALKPVLARVHTAWKDQLESSMNH